MLTRPSQQYCLTYSHVCGKFKLKNRISQKGVTTNWLINGTELALFKIE